MILRDCDLSSSPSGVNDSNQSATLNPNAGDRPTNRPTNRPTIEIEATVAANSVFNTAELKNAAPVPRVHASHLSRETFTTRYRNPGIPVMITGLLDTEYQRWTLDFLGDRLGNSVFPVRFYGQERYTQDKRTWSSTGSGVPARAMSFLDYAAMVRSGEAEREDAYLGRCALKGTVLEQEIAALEAAEAFLGLQVPATSMNLWVGPGGHTSCLHYDPMDGTLMQLHGRKQVLLFPPSQTYNLYPFPVVKQLWRGLTLRAGYSQVYPTRPDFEAFPKLRQALPHAQVGTLNPGDILFLPAGWWHEVASLRGAEMVCSANRFWNVFPVRRALTSWNKWRAHLASVCAGPHIAWTFVSAIAQGENRSTELRKLLQKL